MMLFKIWLFFIWLLPKQVVYWCGVRMLAHTIYDYEDITTVYAKDMLERWRNNE